MDFALGEMKNNFQITVFIFIKINRPVTELSIYYNSTQR